MNERLAAALQPLRDRSFWLVLAGTTVGVIVLALWVGRDALARAGEWEDRAAQTARSEALATAWTRDLEEPTPAERRAWAASRTAVEERGIGARGRVALMQEVAQRAESLGVRDALLSFVAADTLEVVVDRELEGTVFEPAPFALRMTGITNTRTLARLVQTLPPQVELVRLDAVAVPEGVEARLLMLVFLGEGGDGAG